MTSEIIVMNKSAVAMAADSAVTISFGNRKNGNINKKVFNDANKLFRLSKTAPVGIMVYNQSKFMGIAWEVIIKWYRNKRSQVSFDSLEEYVYDFIKTIGKDDCLFPKRIRKEILFHTLCVFYHGVLLKKIKNKIKNALNNNSKGLSEYQIKRLSTSIVEKVLADILKNPYINSFNEDRIRKIEDTCTSVIEKAIKKIFKKIPLSNDSINKLIEIGINFLVREVFPTTDSGKNLIGSGLVVAGFGNKEPYPSFFEIFITSFICDNTIRHKIISRGNCRENNSIIKPFAQRDMVDTFMNGMDPNIRIFLQKYIGNITKELPKKISSMFKYENSDNNQIALEAINKVTKIINKKFNIRLQEINKTYSRPIVQLINSLSKSELANMAESLVNLTSFKRHITPTEETVGSPIDVAVISQGDGFIWINKKQYYNPKYNNDIIK